MAEATQLRKTGKIFQPFRDARRQKIHPSDYADDSFVIFRKAEKKRCFVLRLIRLHSDGCVDTVYGQFRRKMLGNEVALQDGHGIRDPRIACGIIAPKVLVRINLHPRFRSHELNARFRSSPEIEKSSVDRIVRAGDERGLVGAEEKSQGGDFFWFAPASNRRD